MEYFTKWLKEECFFELGVHPDNCLKNDPKLPECFRLYIVREGASIVTLNGRRLWLESPAFLCLNERDRISVEKEEKLKADLIAFLPKIINHHFIPESLQKLDSFQGTDMNDLFYIDPFLVRNEGYNGYLPVSPLISNKTGLLLKDMERELVAQDNNYWPCRSRSFLIELMFLIRRVYGEPRDTQPEVVLTKSPSWIEEVILYLHTHYNEDISINSLASLFHTNRTTLMNRFKEYTSLSINQYMIQFRVKLSAMLLRDSAIPVTEVMIRAGFVDTAHFGKTFKRLTGMSPRIYRNRFNWVLNPQVSPV